MVSDEIIMEENSLLNTIKLPLNLAQLNQNLPKSNYRAKIGLPKGAIHISSKTSNQGSRFKPETVKQPGLPSISSMKDISL